MISQENLEKIEQIVNDFFNKAGFEAEPVVKQEQDEKDSNLIVFVDIQTPEPQFLIGKQGKTLSEIQRLLTALVKKQIKSDDEEQYYIDVDIENYKKKKNEFLKDFCQSIADEVMFFKRDKILDPMSAYERRIIHLELEKRNDIIVESIGQEPERRIVIKIVDNE
ncbi:MAG: R3H domain-containing nucleic acid-binding protein [Patescibacteria group bacterium]|nr:R3H domain-containing nucleic acid-binding protein [Patescibacteria group bacterium]